MKEPNNDVRTKEIAASEPNTPYTSEKERTAKDVQMKIASEKLRYEHANSIYPE
ncbi:hypothetical protein [Paenibacillus thermotolerans]|uniref:hypothetical protein n=1 Tax=Paenibacillus thermotolerans TaxID=3027807 RepID=UPI0023680ACF|nr:MULTISPECIES: hypothetical protein [unclassified Paenibacillus]